MLRSLTAVAVAYLLIGALAMALRLVWAEVFGTTPGPLLWLGWTLLSAGIGGYAVGFITGRAVMQHAVALAALATVLAALTLLLPTVSLPRDYRLGLLVVLPLGVLAGGYLRHRQSMR